MSTSILESPIGTSCKRKQATPSVQDDDVPTNNESPCHDTSFPTSFHFPSRRSVRRRLLSQSTELSNPMSSATTSKIFPATDPADPHQADLRLPIKRRRKHQLLESTSDFPTDFEFSSSRRVRSRQLQLLSGQGHIPYIPATTEAGSATSTVTHKRQVSALWDLSYQIFCLLFKLQKTHKSCILEH
ncbi:unnamed protein product [Urochloa decumbens]|uniref:Uncharacterized protein n=1 Tax=Urochloa decumbens TaxID=240449 RepID=A0ABC9FKA7_9POAL